ncbi:MAG: AAA family ATPase [Planctomycetota bacterium]|nr:AAA family ATPase [Planctomycetota bacterium]
MDFILGQSRAIDVLQAALRNGRLHHAYVFHGPSGVGKFTAARAFARVLLCHEPQTDLAGQVVACDACASCRLLPERPAPVAEPANAKEAGSTGGPVHPDFIVVTKELARFSDERQIRERKLTTIPVEVIEQHFLGPAHRAPQLRHNKVLVIDEAELIAPVGQNKLLKTLEEPPAGMYLILVTSSEDRLLPTIRSRCQRIAFMPLGEKDFDAWLTTREAKADAAPLSATQKQWLLDFAGGSPGRAALALEYNLLAWSESVLPGLDAARKGRTSGRLGATIALHINTFAEQWVDAHANASKEAANKLAAGLMWSMIAQHARRRIAQASTDLQPGAVDAAEAALNPWLGVIDALAGAETELAANVNLGLVCDHLLSVMHRSLSAA